MDGYFVFMNVMACVLAASIVARHHVGEYKEIHARCPVFTRGEYVYDSVDGFIIQTLALAILFCISLSLLRLAIPIYLFGE